MKFIKHLIFLLLVLGIQPLFAQLSSIHYLPPLKQAQSVVQGQVIYLSTPETSAFDVDIYQGTSTTPTATLSISNSSPGIYTPPGGAGENNTTLITGANAGIVLNTAGFRFEANSGKKFYMNWRAAQGGQAGSLVSAGIAGLGTDFRWGGIPQIITSGEAGYQGANSVIGIMATENNTSITIYGYNPSCTFTKNSNISGVNSITDDIINITLNAGQSYVLEAVALYNTANIDGWLGATISSNKKISVNQGHLMFKLQPGGIDFSMTQLTPTSNIGNEYIFIRGNGVDDIEFPVIIATQNNTEIYVNNDSTPYTTLNNGQWVKIPGTKYSQSSTVGNIAGVNMYVRATKDVYAIQSISAGPSGALIDMFQVAPLNCLLDNGINNIPDVIKTGLSTTNLTSCGIILLASSAINESNITIQYGLGSVNTVATSTLTSAKKTVSGSSDWVSYYIPLLTGDIKVNATGPIAVGYLGISGVAGVAGYFSGFGTIPTITVQTNGNGCFPNTTLTATSGFTTYAWYKDDVLIPSATSNTYTPNIAGDYHVVVYNGFCTYPSAKNTVFDCNPEILVTNIASDNYLLPGETTTFTIKVKLLGGSAAQNLQISNLIPAHLTYTSSTVTKGTFSGSGSNYTWNVGTMTNGEENILRVIATAQAVTTAYSETYTSNNTQTFSLGTEVNNLGDDKTENVVIYPGCSSSLAGTIIGAASYCSSTNSTTLTVTDAVGNLQWQSSPDNINFTNISGATTTTLLVTNLASTTYYRVQTTVDTCVEYGTSVGITISQGPAYALTSASGSDTQTLCVNTSLTPITYSTTNTTGVSFSGLPSGVTGAWTNDTVTISGSPSVTGTFNYNISLVGTCTVTISGTITVPNTINSITLTSASDTNAQSINSNVAITTITYATSGATGATISGLPLGVSGIWTNDTLTISGTPTLAGIYNYSITLTGGCGSASGSGTINVNGVSITSNMTGSSTCAGASVTFTATAIGFTSPTYQWYKNGTAISGANASTHTTSTLSNNDQISVQATPGYTVGSISPTGLIANFDAANYNTTSTRWNDQSSSANHMDFYTSRTYSSTKTANYSTDGGGSLVLSNSNFTYGKTISNTGISGNGGKSLSVWVKFDNDFKDWESIAAIGEYDYPKMFEMYTYNDGSGIYFYNHNSGTQTGSSSKLPFNTWYHLTITSDGTSNKVYINGVENASSNYALNTTNSPLYLGASDNWTWNLGGKISTLSLYNTALSSQTILDNYNATKERYTTTGITSNTITTTITAGPSTPTITVTGDACINKTTLSTTSGLSSYTWYKNDVLISGATTNTYLPIASGDYKVLVSNGTCDATSTPTTITNCGVTADGSMSPTVTTLVSNEGGINFGTGINDLGSLFNSTGLTTTTGTIAPTTAVIGGIISATNAVTSSIGVIYSTDANFSTYSSSTIQTNVVAGTYTTTITGLTGVTTYYAKSFIVNKAGTSYGPVVSFTTTTPPVAVGDVYGGGIVFYVLQPGDNGYDANVQHGLIAPFSNTSRQSTNPLPPIVESQIGLSAATISGAQNDDLLFGMTNTEAIIANQGLTGTYAALYCRNYVNPTSKTFNSVTYTFPVFNDWYMPSISEIHKFRAYLYTTHYSQGSFYNYGDNLSYYRGAAGNGNDYAWGKMLSSSMTGQRYKLYYFESGWEDGSTAYNGWGENDRLVVMPIRSF